jgi:hypothetical protein
MYYKHFPEFFPLLAIVVGPVFIWIAVFKWENFFTKSLKATWLANFFGKKGTRIFYVCLGTFLFALGLLKLYCLYHVAK